VGKFKFIKTKIPDLYIVESTAIGDERGYFLESYNKQDFEDAGLTMQFIQDNESRSKKGVLRGLHFQKEHTQGKLVRCTEGEVFDVAVDLRKGSPTFGQWKGVYLSAENKRQFYVPEGFAHGFLVLSETATFSYKCTEYYSPQHESGIIWNDPKIGVSWPVDNIDLIKLSEKDKMLKKLDEINLPFEYKGEYL